MSEVYDCTTPEGLAAGVAAAAAAVRGGGLVVLPTDTVYGVGADAFDVDAVASLLAAKGRGREMPPPVLVPNQRTVDGLAREVPDHARALIRRFWPGALTIVLRAQTSLTWDLGETNGTVALRMPDNETALTLLGEVGPMAVTSANVTGSPPARTAAQAQAQLGAAVAVYLDAGESSCAAASTILDCTGDGPVTLREGAIGRAEVDAALAAASAAATSAAAATRAASAARERAAARGHHRSSTHGGSQGPPRRPPRVAGSRRRRTE